MFHENHSFWHPILNKLYHIGKSDAEMGPQAGTQRATKLLTFREGHCHMKVRGGGCETIA